MDEDFALALQLQFQEEEFIGESSTRRKDAKESSTSIVDEAWEYIDPVPDIHALFIEFNEKYFWRKLDGVEVKWSTRMTLCAGLCSYEGRGGYCSIRLSQPLLKFRPRKDLIQTLLHEMIHAYLFVTHNNKDHSDHGPEFCKHMDRINRESGAHITIYHSFHDEVDLYRQHWWKCNGPCQKKHPFYGLVRRATNRAPGPYDSWWADHQQKCGGSFVKIKEPENYKPSKKAKTKSIGSNKEERSTTNSTLPFTAFSGKGNVLGSGSPLLPKNTDERKDPTLPSPSKKMKQSSLIGFFEKSPGSGQSRVAAPNHSVCLSNTKDKTKRASVSEENDCHLKVITLSKLLNKSKRHFSCASPKRKFSSDSDENSENTLNVKNSNSMESLERTSVESLEMFSDAKRILPKENHTRTCICPACGIKLETDNINTHLDNCLDLGPEIF